VLMFLRDTGSGKFWYRARCCYRPERPVVRWEVTLSAKSTNTSATTQTNKQREFSFQNVGGYDTQ